MFSLVPSQRAEIAGFNSVFWTLRKILGLVHDGSGVKYPVFVEKLLHFARETSTNPSPKRHFFAQKSLPCRYSGDSSGLNGLALLY